MHIFSPIIWLADIDTESEKIGKQAKHLAQLTQAKFPLIPGFIITSTAYTDFLQRNNLEHTIKQLLSTVSFELADSLMQAEHHIKKLFLEAKLSPEFIKHLETFYEQLGTNIITLSLYETDHHGKKQISKNANSLQELTKYIQYAWAEMFAGHALWHRHQLHKDHFQIGAEIIVQKKINGDKKGVVITLDPLTHAKDKLTIITHHPHVDDRYVISKRNLTIVDRILKYQSTADKLTLDEIIVIGAMAKDVEKYLYFPQEITWAFDDKTVYIIDIKPFSALPKKYSEKKSKLPIARGKSTAAIIKTGPIKIIHSFADLQKINSHDVIVMKEITSKLIKQAKKAKAVIITSAHPSKETVSILKHYGIPTIFLSNYSPTLFRNGHHITIHGEKGEIYEGGFV